MAAEPGPPDEAPEPTPVEVHAPDTLRRSGSVDMGIAAAACLACGTPLAPDERFTVVVLDGKAVRKVDDPDIGWPRVVAEEPYCKRDYDRRMEGVR